MHWAYQLSRLDDPVTVGATFLFSDDVVLAVTRKPPWLGNEFRVDSPFVTQWAVLSKRYFRGLRSLSWAVVMESLGNEYFSRQFIRAEHLSASIRCRARWKSERNCWVCRMSRCAPNWRAVVLLVFRLKRVQRCSYRLAVVFFSLPLVYLMVEKMQFAAIAKSLWWAGTVHRHDWKLH